MKKNCYKQKKQYWENNKHIMKPISTSLIIFLASTTIVLGQITTTKIANKTDQVDTIPYDSTKNNFDKNVYQSVGQELYLNELPTNFREFGYFAKFLIDYKKDQFEKDNLYKAGTGTKSKYEELAGKYFKVLEVIKHPKASINENLYGNNFFLKLEEKKSRDIVYCEYYKNKLDKDEFDYYNYKGKSIPTFPFIITGFFEKQKKIIVGQEFIFADKVLEGTNDIETGKPITIKTGQKWKCYDLTIEEKYYVLSPVIQNSLGEKTTIPLSVVFGKWSKGKTYSVLEADNFRNKFGNDIFDMILLGNVKIGMTKEMCRLSWGEPKSINETITSEKNTEQWVYADNYLYFDNEILTAIQ